MIHKDVHVGPWAKTANGLDFYRLRLLMNYPEQYRARYITKTTAIEPQSDLDEELLMSMWATNVDPWWVRLDHANRRTKDYAAAAEKVMASGMYPALGHELDTLCSLLGHVSALGAKNVSLKPYTKVEDQVTFADVVLIADNQPLLLKISPLGEIEKRCWANDWPGQWLFACWVSGSMPKYLVPTVIVVDPDAPGRAASVQLRATVPDLAARFKAMAMMVPAQLEAKSAGLLTFDPPAYYQPLLGR
jgi:hypothetical protein